MTCSRSTYRIYSFGTLSSFSRRQFVKTTKPAVIILRYYLPKAISFLLHKLTHGQNLQSTNWQTLRFKPPPPNSLIGWRVEFRSMEVQMTDFENAAFSVFVVLLSRAILSFNLNFYIPISKVGVAHGSRIAILRYIYR
jgi:hypothetical protein